MRSLTYDSRCESQDIAVVTSFGCAIYNAGHANDLQYAAAGGNATASWHFTGLTPGYYRVSATWIAHANRATNAPFVVDGNVVSVNQRIPPSGFTDSGSSWKDLRTLLITGTELTVSLGTQANGFVIADAIRIEPVTVSESVFIQDDSDGQFSSTGFTPFSQGYRGNARYAAPESGAQATWDFDNLQPGNYRVFATWISHANRASNAPFMINGTPVPVNQRLPPSGLSDQGATWQALTTISVTGSQIQVSLGSNANGYVIADAIRVERVEGFQAIIDNGQAGYAASGFTGYQAGHGGSLQYASAGNGAVATWAFNNLTPGQYRVSATWVAHANRATNAPFKINSGSPIPVNQQQAPSHFDDAGSHWHDLGTITITGNQITVELTAASMGFVIADAVRIELL